MALTRKMDGAARVPATSPISDGEKIFKWREFPPNPSLLWPPNNTPRGLSRDAGFSGESGRRHDCDAYSQEDGQEEGQGKSSRAGKMGLQGLREADSLRLQQVHAPHRP